MRIKSFRVVGNAHFPPKPLWGLTGQPCSPRELAPLFHRGQIPSKQTKKNKKVVFPGRGQFRYPNASHPLASSKHTGNHTPPLASSKMEALIVFPPTGKSGKDGYKHRLCVLDARAMHFISQPVSFFASRCVRCSPFLNKKSCSCVFYRVFFQALAL